MIEAIEEATRDKLVALTGKIPDEVIAGLLFGIGLIATDHVFKIVYRIGALL